MLKSVLCFGDGNTWGARPAETVRSGERARFDEQTRWTGVLGCLLGEGWRVIEEGVPSRTSGYDDPHLPLRNGLATFPLLCDTHRPFDWLVLMLGACDAKACFTHAPEQAADAIEAIGQHAAATGASVLVVAPPPLRSPLRFLTEYAEERALVFTRALAPLYRECAERHGWEFLDAGRVLSVSRCDGVHFEDEAHTRLAQALAAILLRRVP